MDTGPFPPYLTFRVKRPQKLIPEACVPALPLLILLTMGKLVRLSVPQFPHMSVEDNSSICSIGLFVEKVKYDDI